jgi:oligosaccharide reducing-end xylanase
MASTHRIAFIFTGITVILSACAQKFPQLSQINPAQLPKSARSYATGKYRNLFQEYLDKSDMEVNEKLKTTWDQLFYGDNDTRRVYYPVGNDMAYIEDIINKDVRTEGMSYGMMIAVQLDKHEEFNRLWKWVKTYMYQSGGPYRGYFAWHCTTEGKQIDANPASDGEEWFVMALFFASGRWGDGDGIFDYRQQAQEILDTILHKSEEHDRIAVNMFDRKVRQVVFAPVGIESTYTDPSYHLPAYYELWVQQASRDNQFWAEAARASRDFFNKAADPKTGLMPDYANFDGSARDGNENAGFRYDAWRTLSNVAVDYAWFGNDLREVELSSRVLDFLASQGMDSYSGLYTLDGRPLSSDHRTGLVAMAAVAALAVDQPIGQPFVQALWNAEIPHGRERYYDGMLYFLALLHVSGNFQIYSPSGT